MCTKHDFDLDHEQGADGDALERLSVLAGVREFPIRVKCATLAWHTMSAAMSGNREASTSERGEEG
jgi:nitrogen fixation NifU-like protein